MTRTSRTTAKVVAVSGTDHPMTQVNPEDAMHLVAGRGRRVAAYALDMIVFFPFFILAAMTGVGALFAVAIYFALYNSIRGTGRSLGRAAVGQRLLMDNGEEASHGISIARNLTRMLLWMMFFPIFIDLVLMFTGDGRLIADRIFRTRVSEDPEMARAQEALEAARRARSVTGRVEDEADRWDERFEQDELDQIAHEMAYGGDASKDLDDFERRLSSAMGAVPAQDPDLARFERELAGVSNDAIPSHSTVFDFAEEAEVEQEVAAQVTQQR